MKLQDWINGVLDDGLVCERYRDDLANAMLRQKQENEELEQQRIMKKLSKIEGIENMTYKDLVKDIEKGGKFIYFSYAFSFSILIKVFC